MAEGVIDIPIKDYLVEFDADFWGDNVISLDDETDYVNLMVYAKSGAGKTVLGGSDDKVLFLAPEDKGTLSAKRSGSKALKWRVNSWEDIEKAYAKLFDAQEAGGIPFNWVVIDSITHMQQLARRAILDDAVEDNPERDPDTFQIQEWGKWFEMLKRFVLAFNDLEVNVLYTALSVSLEDEEGRTILGPDITGSKKTDMAQTISSYMTSYGCLQVRRRKVTVGERETTEEFRRITWRDTGVLQGKDRTMALAPHTDNMTLKDIRIKIANAGLPKIESKPATKTGTIKAPAKKVVPRTTNEKVEEPANG